MYVGWSTGVFPTVVGNLFIDSCKYIGVNGEALQLHAVFKKLYFYYKSRKCPYQVLQVTWKTCISTTIPAIIYIRYCKSRTLCLNVQWNQRFIWLTHYHHSTKVYWKKNHSFVAVNWHCHFVNTDGNKRVIFSGITLYYCDNIQHYWRKIRWDVHRTVTFPTTTGSKHTHKMGQAQNGAGTNSILQNSMLHACEWWPSKTRPDQVFQPAHITFRAESWVIWPQYSYSSSTIVSRKYLVQNAGGEGLCAEYVKYLSRTLR